MHTSKRRDYAWNTAAGVINAAEAVVMSMVVTRFGLLPDAGVLSMAFAVGNVLMTIGIFGVRMFQASDIKRQYSYGTYIKLRYITLGMMGVTLAVFLFAAGYESSKSVSIALIVFIYMVETMESCIWGHFQSYDLLYVGARMFVTRWSAVIIVFSVCMAVSNDMNASLCCGAAAGLAVFLVWVLVLRRSGREDLMQHSRAPVDGTNPDGRTCDLMKQVFPLFVAEFCSMFIINIPKFAIDRFLDDGIQACYGFVAMPVFVTGLLGQFMYQPKIVYLTDQYLGGKTGQFKKNVGRQIMYIALITLACVAGAAFAGIPVLSVIYHTDLGGYWKELVILQFAGGFLALSGYLNVVLTIIRHQKVILAGYVSALVAGMAILFPAVRYAGTVGAATGYLILMALLFVYYLAAYMKIINGKTIS